MMRKDLLGDILGEGEDVEVNPEINESAESISVDADEREPYVAPVRTASEPDAFTRKRRPRVEIPTEAEPGPSTHDSVLYVQARRVAELKFSFYKWLGLLIPVNVLFFCMAYFQIGPSGKYWFAWPLAVTGLLVLSQYFRAFVLKGRSLHGMIEGTIHDMAMRESRKKKYKDFL